MNDAGAAKTRGRLHERRRSRGLNGASASAADARLVVQGGWHKEAAE
jgi:hypothetical protein